MELRPEEITKIIRSQIKKYEHKMEASETAVLNINCNSNLGIVHWSESYERRVVLSTVLGCSGFFFIRKELIPHFHGKLLFIHRKICFRSLNVRLHPADTLL